MILSLDQHSLGASRLHRETAEDHSSEADDQQHRHGADEDTTKEAQLRKAKTEFRLPDREQHVDQIRVPVVQRMGTAGNGSSSC